MMTAIIKSKVLYHFFYMFKSTINITLILNMIFSGHGCKENVKLSDLKSHFLHQSLRIGESCDNTEPFACTEIRGIRGTHHDWVMT